MNANYHSSYNSPGIFEPGKIIPRVVMDGAETRTGLIRFEEKKEQYFWAHPEAIFFVKSADHYVKALVGCGSLKKWMCRHCTLKELLAILPSGSFIRLNKFYLINRGHFSSINENQKMLYLDDDTSIDIPHRISPFILDILKK